MKKIFTIIIVSWSVLMFAGDPSRKGTTGAEQLLIPVGARGIATGGAFLSNYTGLEALYYNPAGFGNSEGSEAMFSYMSYIADINVSYFAAGTKLGEFGSVALSIKTLSFGDIPVTTNDAPDGTGANYSPGFIVAGLTYAKVVTDKVSIGVNAKIISETILDVSATGFALDFGVQYRFPDNLSIGAAVKNIGTNMSYKGTGLQSTTQVPGSQVSSPNGTYEVVTEEFQIPGYFELSTAYSYNINKQNNFIVGAAFRNNNDSEDQLNFGLEYGFSNTFFIRGGYNMLTQNNDQSIYNFTAGAGINYGFSDGMGLTFDYAFREVKDFPLPNHIFTVKLSLQ